MKQCKECLEMYSYSNPNIGHNRKWGEFRIFGDYCPKCGTFNSHINKNSIVSIVIFIAIALILNLMGLL